MPPSFEEIPDLAAELRSLMAQVPPGRVTTYGALAEALGSRLAARWVGHVALHHAADDPSPWHRVVRADGQLGNFAEGGAVVKARLLAAEAVTVEQATGEQGVVDLDRYLFADFRAERPLERLAVLQQNIVAHARLGHRRRMPKFFGGVDVSYPSPDCAVAAYALVETSSGRLVWSTVHRRAVSFPYITTFLAFRELPVLLELIEQVRVAERLAPVVLVDGSGMLHQRHAGIATHLGVLAELPTIGVTKKLLCGTVDIEQMEPLESRPVAYDDRLVGVALRPTAGSRRPIFVSPGNGVDVAFAEQAVRQLLAGRRLPEPLYWADRLSRAAGKPG